MLRARGSLRVWTGMLVLHQCIVVAALAAGACCPDHERRPAAASAQTAHCEQMPRPPEECRMRGTCDADGLATLTRVLGIPGLAAIPATVALNLPPGAWCDAAAESPLSVAPPADTPPPRS